MIRATPFNYPYNGQLRPEQCALLVIDLQRDFLAHDGYFARQGYDPAPLRSIIDRVNALIEACRRAGMRIIHTRQGYRADLADMTVYEKWRRKERNLEGALLRGSPGFELIDELNVSADDYIVDKTCNSAFTHTDLEHILHAQGISHLLFSGCTTDVCVHTTLREACDRNFQCLTISDACASGDQYAHEAALHMIGVEFGIFGALTDTAAVLEGLATFQPGAH